MPADPADPADPANDNTAAATALLALWNDVDPGMEAAYNAWHAVEHVPERLTVPGMLWARRFADPAATGQDPRAPRYLTLYGLRDAAVLESEPYQQLLREPTPASRRMRPALCHLSRWVCRLPAGQGAVPPDAPWLAVQVLPAGGEADMAGMPAPLARLDAERLEAAAPLPWLVSAQAGGVEGERLCCRWLAAAPAAATLSAGAVLYQRLPLAAAHAGDERRP